MNTCRTCRRDLAEGEAPVCHSCWNTDFEGAKVITDDLRNIFEKHNGAAAYFSRCRTTSERVGIWLADLSELLEELSEYVRCGGGWN
jgi:hypothetical protein